MRLFIFIILLFLGDPLVGQDSTLVANTKLIEIATETKSLREQVNQLTTKLNLYEALAQESQRQLRLYDTLRREDDKFISLMQTELQLRTTVYSELISDTYKPKPKGLKEALWFGVGIVVAYTGVAIATKL